MATNADLLQAINRLGKRVDKRMDEMDKKFDEKFVENATAINNLGKRMDKKIDDLKESMDKRLSRLERRQSRTIEDSFRKKLRVKYGGNYGEGIMLKSLSDVTEYYYKMHLEESTAQSTAVKHIAQKLSKNDLAIGKVLSVIAKWMKGSSTEFFLRHWIYNNISLNKDNVKQLLDDCVRYEKFIEYFKRENMTNIPSIAGRLRKDEFLISANISPNLDTTIDEIWLGINSTPVLGVFKEFAEQENQPDQTVTKSDGLKTFADSVQKNFKRIGGGLLDKLTLLVDYLDGKKFHTSSTGRKKEPFEVLAEQGQLGIMFLAAVAIDKLFADTDLTPPLPEVEIECDIKGEIRIVPMRSIEAKGDTKDDTKGPKAPEDSTAHIYVGEIKADGRSAKNKKTAKLQLRIRTSIIQTGLEYLKENNDLRPKLSTTYRTGLLCFYDHNDDSASEPENWDKETKFIKEYESSM